jgi:hypothetical protein
MYIRVIGLFSLTEILLSILAQTDIMSENLFSVFAQLPLVAVIVWLWLQTDKRQREENEKFRLWLEHMMDIQRVSIRETYQDSTVLLNTLVAQIETKQRNMSDRIELLTQQLAINTTTINEVAKVDSIVSELIDRLEKK